MPDLTGRVDSLEKDLNARIDELRELVQRFSEIGCSNCKKKVLTYPMGGGYYREADGTVLCSSECLDAHMVKVKQ